jgi:membrane protein implicated in regulation of membrane protease activity
MDVTQVLYWHWWVAAAVLAILEMVMPGTLLIFFAAAAAVVGALAFAIPGLSWQVEFVAFAALSIAGIFAWRAYRKAHPEDIDGTDHPMLNKRADQYVGRIVVVQEAIVNGTGKAKVDDSIWRVSGPDAPEGTRVKVVAIDGGFLKVELA